MATHHISQFLSKYAHEQDCSILSEYSDETTDADEAVRRLTSAGGQQNSTPESARKASRISSLSVQLSEEFPSEHEKLVELVNAVYADIDSLESFGWELRAEHHGKYSLRSSFRIGNAKDTRHDAICIKIIPRESANRRCCDKIDRL
jgi:hypothetical protein